MSGRQRRPPQRFEPAETRALTKTKAVPRKRKKSTATEEEIKLQTHEEQKAFKARKEKRRKQKPSYKMRAVMERSLEAAKPTLETGINVNFGLPPQIKDHRISIKIAHASDLKQGFNFDLPEELKSKIRSEKMPKFKKIARNIFFVDGERVRGRGLAVEKEDVEVCSCKTKDMRRAQEQRQLRAKGKHASEAGIEDSEDIEDAEDEDDDEDRHVKGCGMDCLNRLLQIQCSAHNCSYQDQVAGAKAKQGKVTEWCRNRVFTEKEERIVEPFPLLKFASQLMDRSVLTTGAGTTGAGLTVAAQRDASTGEWGLEAGALVLADGGICCIDEFACVRPADRATIHEAMEQQTLSVAKAGLVTQLNTRCSVFAILNPKQGEYDDMLDLSANTGIGTALLSRFDVILLMLDQRDKHWDRRVTQHIMQALPSAEPNAATAKVGQAEQAEPAAIPGGKGEEVRAGSTGKAGKDKKSGLPSGPYGPCWPLDRLKAYIAHARAALKPRMTANAKTLLLRYYHRQRGAGGGEVAGGGRAASRTTVRLLESLVRLAQAHARLMWRGRVTTQDAVVAVLVTEGSVGSSTLSSGWFAMHGGAAKAMGIPFDAAPDAVYAQQQAEVLRFLGLSGNHQWTDTYDYPAELTARPSPQPPSLTSATSPTPALPGAHLPGQPIAPALPSPSSAPPCPLLLEHVVAAAPFNAHSAPLPTPPSASYDLPAVPAFAPIAAPSSRSIALPASVPFNRAPPRRMPAAPVVHSAISPAISPITTAGPATPFARASADVLAPPAAIPPHRNHNQSSQSSYAGYSSSSNSTFNQSPSSNSNSSSSHSPRSQSRVSHTQSSQGHSNVLGDDGVLGGDVDDLDLDL